eukprot:gnl/Chilomastix_cuspidata/6834.p1 GENE.gnl/Chilomastix_cuspidata/6834~~gnl/Chilomastix_cuspidata/6834.p1  ORF type:complete len:235 (+),score=35.37 gnl/Chilomastix_cuspidata/6834:25-705(+)
MDTERCSICECAATLWYPCGHTFCTSCCAELALCEESPCFMCAPCPPPTNPEPSLLRRGIDPFFLQFVAAPARVGLWTIALSVRAAPALVIARFSPLCVVAVPAYSEHHFHLTVQLAAAAAAVDATVMGPGKVRFERKSAYPFDWRPLARCHSVGPAPAALSASALPSEPARFGHNAVLFCEHYIEIIPNGREMASLKLFLGGHGEVLLGGTELNADIVKKARYSQ